MEEDPYYYEDRSCLRSQCRCLCGSGACRCCCRICPAMNESTSTRFMYIFILMLSIGVMAAMMSTQVQEFVSRNLPEGFKICQDCDDVVGYMAVYRLGLAIAAFHLLLMMVTFGVKSSKDCRAGLHNGFWFYKVMLLIALCIAVFFIPDYKNYFINAWMYTAMVGAALFLVIQLILLVFMVHRWTDRIVRRVNNGASAVLWYGVVVWGVILLNYLLCAAATLFLYYFFAWDAGCHRNQWFILGNAGACVVVSIVAAFTKGTGRVSLRFFQSSLISLYVHYLTWTAISSTPRHQRTEVQAPLTGTGQWSALFMQNSFYQPHLCGPRDNQMMWIDAIIPYVSVFIMFCTVIYASVGTSNPDNCQDLEFPDCPIGSQQDPNSYNGHVAKEDIGGQVLFRNEKFRLTYSYSLFHVMLTLATLFMMMSLTAWYTPDQADLSNFGKSWSAAWIKMVTSWVCLLIYLLCMAFPALIPKRYRQHLKVTQGLAMRSPSRQSSYSGYRNGSSRGVGRGYFGSNGSLGVAERLRRYSITGSVHGGSEHSSLDAVPLTPRHLLKKSDLQESAAPSPRSKTLGTPIHRAVHPSLSEYDEQLFPKVKVPPKSESIPANIHKQNSTSEKEQSLPPVKINPYYCNEPVNVDECCC